MGKGGGQDVGGGASGLGDGAGEEDAGGDASGVGMRVCETAKFPRKQCQL
jgi:hypothetical protein